MDAVAGPAGPERTPLARRLTRVAAWIGGAALLILVLDLLGIPVSDWIGKLFDKVGEVPAWAIVAGVLLESAQTSLAAVAWFAILRAALPSAAIPYRLVLACYAAAVALNGFLPANIGTWAMLLMFTTLIAGASFAMVLSAAPSRSSSASSPTTPCWWC